MVRGRAREPVGQPPPWRKRNFLSSSTSGGGCCAERLDQGAADEDALRLAAEILEDNARHLNLDILWAWPGKMTDNEQALIANTEFIVRYRTVD